MYAFFDMVNHKIVLETMEAIGIKGNSTYFELILPTGFRESELTMF